jgi:FkbM family methyltransferase
LIYIIKENPLIPYGLYNKNDHNKLENFIKKYLYLSFNLDIPNDLFSKEELDLYKRRIKSFDEIKIKNGYFEFSNFKSYKLFFENFIKPLDYKVSNKKINLAFDLGACYGDTAFIFHKYLKAKKVYAFEPDPDNFKILIENLRLNKLENAVIPIELGVGKENGSFYLTKAGAGSAIGTKKSNNAVKVKLTTIDNFVEENKIKKVDFIKMDIEGAEFDALKGAVKTIKRDKPDLLIAIYHKGEHFFEIPGWLKKLVPQYNLRFIAMNGASPVIERYIGASV